jgi:hypothetical protein
MSRPARRSVYHIAESFQHLAALPNLQTLTTPAAASPNTRQPRTTVPRGGADTRSSSRQAASLSQHSRPSTGRDDHEDPTWPSVRPHGRQSMGEPGTTYVPGAIWHGCADHVVCTARSTGLSSDSWSSDRLHAQRGDDRRRPRAVCHPAGDAQPAAAARRQGCPRYGS